MPFQFQPAERLSYVLCVLCIFCGPLLQAQALDRDAFTITHYDLQLRIEPAQQRLGVRGKIMLRNDSSAPQKNLSLQISSSLDWRALSANGKPLEFVAQPYTSDIDHTGSLSEAIVNLPREVSPKSSIELEIGYEGTIPLNGSRLGRIGVPPDIAQHTDWDQIGKNFAAVRGAGYVVWYPISTQAANLSDANSVPEITGEWQQRSAQSAMHVQICVWDRAGELTALMNDPVSAPPSKPASEGEATCSDHNFPSLAETVPLFAIGAYEHLQHPALAISYLSGHKTIAANYAQAAEKVLPFITYWFGAPREPARLAELLDPYAAPYENGPLLLTPLHEIDSGLAQVVAVHQLTHASFSSPRPWIYEGVAHFAQALYRERQTNRQTALDFMMNYRSAILDTEKTLASDDKAATAQSLINTCMEELYRSKAMYVWWMLRDMVGDQALKEALANYHPDQDKEPSYWQHLVETKSKRDLEWFFDDWVYRDRGLPDFRVESVYPRQTMQNAYMVTITVENLGAAGAEVPITVRSANGEITKPLEVRGKSKNTIRIVVPSYPLDVTINDGSVPESDIGNNTFTIPANATNP